MKNPIGKRRQSIYNFIKSKGSATKAEIVAATGITGDQARVILFRACSEGELIHDGAKRNGRYTIGTLLERVTYQTKEEVAAKAKEYKRAYLARQQKMSDKRVIKQTKMWNLQPMNEVTVVWPENVKVTVCPSYKYEPLVVGRHV